MKNPSTFPIFRKLLLICILVTVDILEVSGEYTHCTLLDTCEKLETKSFVCLQPCVPTTKTNKKHVIGIWVASQFFPHFHQKCLCLCRRRRFKLLITCGPESTLRLTSPSNRQGRTWPNVISMHLSPQKSLYTDLRSATTKRTLL